MIISCRNTPQQSSLFVSVHNTFEDSEATLRDKIVIMSDASDTDSEAVIVNHEGSRNTSERMTSTTRPPSHSFGSKPPRTFLRNSCKFDNSSTRTGYTGHEYSSHINSSRGSTEPFYTNQESSSTVHSEYDDTGEGKKDLRAIYTEIAEINAKLKVCWHYINF